MGKSNVITAFADGPKDRQMLKRWIETSGRVWALFPLRLAIGYGFLAHG
jgi:hypothetical protein